MVRKLLTMISLYSLAGPLAPFVLGWIASLALSLPLSAKDSTSIAATERQWGEETMTQIDKDFWMPGRGLYAGQGKVDVQNTTPPHREAALMWACGVQLSALAEAAKADRDAYGLRLISYADAVQVYWQHDDLGGYDVLPCPKPDDRYYDDNAWMVLALAKTFEVTQEPRFLRRAEDTMKFILSGEDDKLGGGIYWHETKKESKNTCSNAPTITGALRLYYLTGKHEYLDDASRLYHWTKSQLQDTDGLYWDSISLEGKVSKAKYSYNSALMIRAACLFYQVTGDKDYLNDACRIGQAAQARWVRPDGSINDGGRFGFLLLGSFLALHDETSDPQWLRTVDDAVQFIHAKLRDPNGHYPVDWKTAQMDALKKFELLDQASVAHAFFEASNAH